MWKAYCSNFDHPTITGISFMLETVSRGVWSLESVLCRPIYQGRRIVIAAGRGGRQFYPEIVECTIIICPINVNLSGRLKYTRWAH